MTYNLSLANIVPAASAFAVRVNSTSRTVTAVSVSGTKVFLTLASPVVFGDVVTVAYTKPASNQLQTSAGGQAATFTAQNVINNCTIPGNQPPIINISSPTKSNSYIAPANITIDVTASDPDGSVSRVEFWTDNVKLGESTTAPYSFVWKEVPEGTYSITAAVIDNQNLKTVSGAVSVIVEKSANVTNQLPVVKISLPNNNKKYKKNEKILIEVIATDADGSINKVELKNGKTTIVEMTTTPYIFSWEPAETGTYFISAIATDNQGATNSSTDLELIVENLTDPNAFTVSLYPNPNDGRFTIEFPVYDNDISRKISIITLTGKRVYEAIVEPESYLKEIDVSGSIPGTYIIMISDNSGVVMTQKFIKY